MARPARPCCGAPPAPATTPPARAATVEYVVMGTENRMFDAVFSTLDEARAHQAAHGGKVRSRSVDHQ